MKNMRKLLFVTVLAPALACIPAGCDSGDGNSDSTAGGGDLGGGASTNAAPATVDGRWIGDVSVGGSPPEDMTMSLVQNGTALSGSINGTGLTGSIAGSRVEFTAITGAASPTLRTIWTYSGTLDSNRRVMEGTVRTENLVQGIIDGVWRAAR